MPVDRMPSFADYGQLPCQSYPFLSITARLIVNLDCEALGLELQRFRPAVPSAVPHCLTEDDV